MTGPALRLIVALLPSLAVLPLAVLLNLPWPIDPAARAGLPYLVLPLIHAAALRAPERLPAPILLAAGLLADLCAGTPLGFSALLYLGVLGATRAMRQLSGERAAGAALSMPVAAIVAIGIATLVPLAFTLHWPDLGPILAGIGLGFSIEAGVRLALGGVRLAFRAAARGAA